MNEKLKQSEKIHLATHSICFMANSLSAITNDFMRISSMKKSAIKHEEFLEKQSKKLIQIMNDIGDHLNNHDAFTELDCEVLNPVFGTLNPELERNKNDNDREIMDKTGLNPSLCIIDEYHTHKDDDRRKIME